MKPERNNTRRSTRFLPVIALAAVTAPLMIGMGVMMVFVRPLEAISEGQTVSLSAAAVWLVPLIKWIGPRPGIGCLLLGMWIAFLAATTWSVRRLIGAGTARLADSIENRKLKIENS